MHRWNMVITVQPGAQHVSNLTGELRRFGEVHGTPFRDVLAAWADDPLRVIDFVLAARHEGAAWAQEVSRIIPVERVFEFTPENLAQLWSEALPAFMDRMRNGSCHVRLERRGLIGQVHSGAVEQAVANTLFDLAEQRGLRLSVSFADPDYIVLGETLNTECGLALLTRDLRSRYPLMQAR